MWSLYVLSLPAQAHSGYYSLDGISLGFKIDAFSVYCNKYCLHFMGMRVFVVTLCVEQTTIKAATYRTEKWSQPRSAKNCSSVIGHWRQVPKVHQSPLTLMLKSPTLQHNNVYKQVHLLELIWNNNNNKKFFFNVASYVVQPVQGICASVFV